MTVSTTCSNTFGPAMNPSLVIWPMIKMGIFLVLASSSNLTVLSLFVADFQ
jgi:hypothetical protein